MSLIVHRALGYTVRGYLVKKAHISTDDGPDWTAFKYRSAVAG